MTNFKFDEGGRKFSKRIEYTVGKGEIARYEQFLPFPQCFQKTCTADSTGLAWERVKGGPHGDICIWKPPTNPFLAKLQEMTFFFSNSQTDTKMCSEEKLLQFLAPLAKGQRAIVMAW